MPVMSSRVSHPSPAVNNNLHGRSNSSLSVATSSLNSSQPSKGEISSPSIRRLWLWGENAHGELSSGDERDQRTPLELKNFSARNEIAQFSLGLNHSVCLSLTNDVFTCGSWISGLLGHEDRANVHKLKKLKQFSQLKTINPGNPIIAIACGDRHSVALHASGTLYGKLGRSGDSHNTYYLVTALEGKRVTHVDCGNWHTAVSTDEGEVFTFGGGGKHFNKGALGVGDTEDSLLPKKVPTFGFGKISVIDICCGGYHTLALTNDRRIYSWGRGDFGQLGLGHDNNETEPKLIETLVNQQVSSLAAGENHSLATLLNGEVWSWGYGQQGQLGHGEGHNENVPKRIEFFHQRNIPVVQVAAGWRHSLCLTLEQHVYSWGHGDKGQLGHGDTKSLTLPKVIDGLLGKDIKQIRAGGSHSLAFNTFFKAAQEMVIIQQQRESKQSNNQINEEEKYTGNGNNNNNDKTSPTITTTSHNNLPRQQQQFNESFLSNNNNNQSFLSSQYNSSSLQSSAQSLCVEIVFSGQVSLTHRFITFQTHCPSSIFTPVIHGYIESCYRNDSGMVFDNFIVSPGNLEPRSNHSHIDNENDRAHASHIYDYDDGPSRVTMMIVTRTLARDENLWPDWANEIYSRLEPVCKSENSNQEEIPFIPCMREIRPQRH